jgi:hypothetical protein
MEDRLKALEQLGRLRDQKVLSEAEFKTEKARLLAMDNVPAEPPRQVPPTTVFAKLKQRKVWIPGALAGAVAIGVYFGLNITSSMKSGENAQLAATSKESTQADGQPPRLSAAMKFDKTSECAPGNELSAVFADLRALESNSVTKAVTVGLGGPVLPVEVMRDEQSKAVIAMLAAPGMLNGLRVTELRTTRFDGSGAEVQQIRFAESPEQVRTKLNEAGFEIPKPNELKSVELEGGRGLVYGVEGIPNGAALTCARL